MRTNARSGFTMLEVAIAFALVVVLLFNTSQLIGTASKGGRYPLRAVQ